MFCENNQWNYDYARLASDNGFSFEKHKVDDFDKNKICLIDIDRIIHEKDVETVEKFIPCVTQFTLEQAQILDENFVKIFRLGQLSIEYLLFCKRYLDQTLIKVREELNTVKEENKELNLFVEELKQHIAVLMKDIKDKTTTFKCEHCNKIFSSEEFLNSHIKRRHSRTDPPLEVETSKLHLEIKELKGRLNSAEKMIQKEQVESKSEKEMDEVKRIDELQQKFEDLRVQVQSELKILQAQHHFQEKYEQLFEKMAHQSYSVVDKGGAGDLGRKESTTQTDTDIYLQGTSTYEFEEKHKENIPELDTQKQISEFGEALDIKVTSSLQKIETQMQSFWNKLNEMEVHRKIYGDSDNQTPPKVKPRSKYTVTHHEKEEISDLKKHVLKENRGENAKPLITKKDITEISSPKKKSVKKEPAAKAIEKDEVKPQKKEMRTVPSLPIESKTSGSSSETEAETETEISVKQPPTKPTKKNNLTNTTKKLVVSDELFKHFKKEVEQIVIMGRLQDLGVSPEWKGLPNRSFQRVMAILNHQATLMKKTYPDFDIISSKIEKEVNAKVQGINSRNKGLKQLLKDTPRKEKKVKAKDASQHIEIKNRKMYETDSESDVQVNKVKEKLSQFSEPYSAVIEELKSVTTKVEDSDDLNSVNEEVKNEDQTKGVLKNYPSVVSLTKKKVLFNLDNESKQTIKDESNTTSVASSVLDGTPRKKEKNYKDKDIEDLSDFDFSDM